MKKKVKLSKSMKQNITRCDRKTEHLPGKPLNLNPNPNI